MEAPVCIQPNVETAAARRHSNIELSMILRYDGEGGWGVFVGVRMLVSGTLSACAC